MTNYDLHTHSIASDGSLAPEDLVTRAAAAGVRVLALTDHDTMAGIPEALQAAARSGITLVSGVEISVTWSRRTVHVLGLHVNPQNRDLQEGLARLREFRAWRAEEIGRRLERAGIPECLEGARALAQGDLVSRTHFARHLVSLGRAKCVRSVFRKFLTTDKPGHVAGQWADLDAAVAWIRGAGGQAVIAHPARYKLTASKLNLLLAQFGECGGVGIEVVSGSHSRDETHTMAGWAHRTGMLASQGSDYHGPEKPWVELGRLPDLPSGCEPIWQSELWRGVRQAGAA